MDTLSFTRRQGYLATALTAAVAFLSADPGTRAAGSNVNADHPYAWSANAGWLNWRGDVTSGVEVGEFVCSGFVYGANIGWINLGNGTPANGIQYQNISAGDFGVNVNSDGRLRGLAYGANVGWINFETLGDPKVDLASGKLSGFVYGANLGWMSLGDSGLYLAVDSIASGADTNGNGIPDAWELMYAGNLTTFTATGDYDHDGATDLQEYLADTNPLDPNDKLEIVAISLSVDHSQTTVVWKSKLTRQYQVEMRSDLSPDAVWQDSGLGLQMPDPNSTVTTRTVPASGTHDFYQIRAVRPLAP
jgi:hypothetical protein